jgi:hypothetical protein
MTDRHTTTIPVTVHHEYDVGDLIEQANHWNLVKNLGDLEWEIVAVQVAPDPDFDVVTLKLVYVVEARNIAARYVALLEDRQTDPKGHDFRMRFDQTRIDGSQHVVRIPNAVTAKL